eukprot:7362645-Ditylum_brightwellii.AAC.1
MQVVKLNEAQQSQLLQLLQQCTPVLKGKRNKNDGMWYMKLSQNETMVEKDTSLLRNNIYESKCGKDVVNYLHAAAFCPYVKTWKKAIAAGYFTTWPDLTVDMVNKYLDKSMATAKGHLVQQWQNLHSTVKMTPISPSVMTRIKQKNPLNNLRNAPIICT